MSRYVAQAILDAEAAYKESSINVTETCLAIEKDCKHEIWCGRDWYPTDYGGSFAGIYICLHCRMEVHVSTGSYTSHKTPPENSIVIKPNQCNVKDVLDLRVQGDRRGALTERYSSIDKWPKREGIRAPA